MNIPERHIERIFNNGFTFTFTYILGAKSLDVLFANATFHKLDEGLQYLKRIICELGRHLWHKQMSADRILRLHCAFSLHPIVALKVVNQAP